MSKKNIAPFITYREYQCSHCNRLPPAFYDHDGQRTGHIPYIYKEFFEIFEELRTKWGKPIRITSGYRCPKYQHKLYDQGMTNAILSPHSTGLALDLDCKSMNDVDVLAGLAESVSPELRIGIYKYKMTFVHIDAAYMVSPILSRQWQRGVRWYA